MRLIRFGQAGQEKPGVAAADGTCYDLSAQVRDYDEDFFESGGLAKVSDLVRAGGLPVVPAGTRLGPPIARPSKIVCVGLNYGNHAFESKMPMPKEPIFFFKSTTAITGPNDRIVIPRNSFKTDWEVELAIVIGKKATYVEEKDALDHIAGYMLHNDVSERAFQLERGGQWVKGKSADTFAPIGPWMVTTDEITDPHALRLWLKLNGKTMQEESSGDLIFKIPFLIHYITQFMTLLPGDVISTGTPSGVGMGQEPPFYLKHGDVIELGIDGLGSATQHVVSYERSNE